MAIKLDDYILDGTYTTMTRIAKRYAIRTTEVPYIGADKGDIFREGLGIVGFDIDEIVTEDASLDSIRQAFLSKPSLKGEDVWTKGASYNKFYYPNEIYFWKVLVDEYNEQQEAGAGTFYSITARLKTLDPFKYASIKEVVGTISGSGTCSFTLINNGKIWTSGKISINLTGSSSSQTSYNKETIVCSSQSRVGQKKTISNMIVSRLGFWFRKDLAATSGDVYYRIRRVSDDSIISEKFAGSVVSFSTGTTYTEITFDSPALINEEVRLCLEVDNGGSTGLIIVYQNTDVKAGECLSQYSSTWGEAPTKDCSYIVTYSNPSVNPTIIDASGRSITLIGTYSSDLIFYPNYTTFQGSITMLEVSQYLTGTYPKLEATNGDSEVWQYTQSNAEASGTVKISYEERYY